MIPSLLPLSPVQPQPIGVDTIFALALAAAIVVGALVAFVFRKHRKAIAVAATVVVVAVAGFAAVWYTEPNISYWLMSPYTTATEDNPLTMKCENNGHLAGTFDLEVSFLNAHVSMKTSLPYQLLDDRTVKFTFTLQPGEKQSRDMWFIIDHNVTDFYVYLVFQHNGGNFLVRSSPGGVDTVSYQKDVGDSNFTTRSFFPPP